MSTGPTQVVTNHEPISYRFNSPFDRSYFLYFIFRWAQYKNHGWVARTTGIDHCVSTTPGREKLVTSFLLRYRPDHGYERYLNGLTEKSE